MKKLYLFMLLVSFGLALQAQPSISFSKVYGGNNEEEYPNITQMPNGDFIVAAYSESTNLNHTNKGQADIYVLRLKTNGDTVWTNLIGGAGYDLSQDVMVNSLGQIVILGQTYSNNSGDIGPTNGSSDFLFLRLDANNGTILRSENFGNQYDDRPQGIIELTNHRYLAWGTVGDASVDVTGPLKGSYDGWLAVLDSNGYVIKNKVYGGSSNDEINTLIVGSDGNYYFIGATGSPDKDLNINYGRDDGWVAKLDTSLNLIWSKNFGGSDNDQFYVIKEFYDGSLFLAGSTQSDDVDFVNVQNTDVNEGNITMLRIDTAGNIMWINCYGGTEEDNAADIFIRDNKEILLVGTTSSNDIDVSNNYGNSDDVWIVDLDSNGNILWEKNYGGNNTDQASRIIPDDTGNVYIFGQSRSNDIDLPTNNGSYDLWMFKLCMPADTAITKNNYIYTSNHSYQGVTYQWVDCNSNSLIAGATNKTFTATKNGDYALIINTGCRQDTTDCFNVNGITNNIAQVEIDNGIVLYPNPGTGVFTIQYDQEQGDISINVTTITGRKVMYNTHQTQHNKLIVQLENVPDGFYIINVKQGVQTHNFKFQKN